MSETIIASHNKIMNETFIASMNEIINDTRNCFKECINEW